MPPVVGKTEVEAVRMAEKAGLKVKVQKRTDATTPENVVIETRPAPNSSVKKDSSLTIVVSSGPGQNRSQIRQGRGSRQFSPLAELRRSAVPDRGWPGGTGAPTMPPLFDEDRVAAVLKRLMRNS